MKGRFAVFAAALALALPLAGCGGSDSGTVPPPPPPAPLRLTTQQVFAASDRLQQPIDLQAPAGDARYFIAERPGRLRVVDNGALRATPFLDIGARVTTGGEAGLLSFAFHPQYASGQPFVFVHFIEAGSGDIVVERFRVSAADPNVLQTPGEPVIRIAHPGFSNHYGGRVAFGPDAMLYLSTGDGGGGGDPNGNGQNATTLLGKLPRLNVNQLPYTVPADNPNWAQAGARRENWAIGLRNAWRYAFDPAGGQLYIADVGQARIEEINVVAATSAGLNYGWNTLEGSLCYPIDPCSKAGFTLPVAEYDHSQGCSIIGGYVYRGSALPELAGRYLYSDYCSGWVRSLRVTGGLATEETEWIASIGTNVAISFGADASGELYLLAADGRVLKLVRG